MFFMFLVLIHAYTAFPLLCPEPAQWSIRARSICHDPSKYSCLKNDLIYGFSENCTISDFLAPGRKGVLRGGLDADICSQERYHPWPIKYYTNVSTNCIFLKSVCDEEGQVVYGNGNRNTDINCRCDYTRGYDFIGKPRNPCFCVPSEEDCSCYVKTCIDKTYFLSPDYECIHARMNTTTANCRAINKQSVSKEKNDSNKTDTTITEHILKPVQRKLYWRIIVIALCIGFILVYCIYELIEKSNCKATTLFKMSQPMLGHIAKEEDFENQAAVEGLSKSSLHNKLNTMNDLKLLDRFEKETLTNSEVDLEKAKTIVKISLPLIEEEDLEHKAAVEGINKSYLHKKLDIMKDLNKLDRFDKETFTNSEEQLDKATTLVKISHPSVGHIAEEEDFEHKSIEGLSINTLHTKNNTINKLKLTDRFVKETPTCLEKEKEKAKTLVKISHPLLGNIAEEEDLEHKTAEGLSISNLHTKRNVINDLELSERSDIETNLKEAFEEDFDMLEEAFEVLEQQKIDRMKSSAKAPWEPLTVLFIENKLNYADKYSRPPPYDTVKGFDCEGDGSDSGSLSSLNTSTPEVDHDFGQLNEWGSKFAKLAYMYNKYEDSD